MGVLELIKRALNPGVQQMQANPAEEWLRSQMPGLLANGERLPPPPPGWTPPGGELPPARPAAPAVEAVDGYEQPAAPRRKRGGVLGALESVFAPDPGSFWWSAMNNGIYNAKAGQQDYRLKQQLAQAGLKAAQTKGEFQVIGNNVIHYKPEGGYEIIQPPQTPGEKERLFQMWSSETDPHKKSMLARMLPGIAYDPSVIGMKADAATRVVNARGEQTRKTNAAKPQSTKLPTGFVLNP